MVIGTTENVATVLERRAQEDQLWGAAVVVLKDGQTVAEHYAGAAAPNLPAGPQVLWPIASISKVYTAAAIMRLVEEGSFTLNTPIHLILPGFTGEGREEVRLRHLLTHTAGFRYESPEMEQRLRTHAPRSELVREALESPLLFKPGTQFSYADYNYLIAGYLAELVTDQDFPRLVNRLVLEPAALKETFFPPSAGEEDRTAYIRGVLAEGSDGAMYNSRYSRDLAHPAFGVFATTADLARFGSMFMPGGPRFLSDGTVHAMTVDQTGGVPGVHPSMKGYAADVHIPWGFGFAVQSAQVPCLYSDLASFETFGHGGASGCQLICDPVLGIVVAVTSNAHLRLGREAWYRRMQSIINNAFAECTRQTGSRTRRSR